MKKIFNWLRKLCKRTNPVNPYNAELELQKAIDDFKELNKNIYLGINSVQKDLMSPLALMYYHGFRLTHFSLEYVQCSASHSELPHPIRIGRITVRDRITNNYVATEWFKVDNLELIDVQDYERELHKSVTIGGQIPTMMWMGGF